MCINYIIGNALERIRQAYDSRSRANGVILSLSAT